MCYKGRYLAPQASEVGKHNKIIGHAEIPTTGQIYHKLLTE